MTVNIDWLAMVVLNSVSGNPDDRFVNDWHLHWAGAGAPGGGDFEYATEQIRYFYDEIAGGQGEAISETLSGVISRVADPKPHMVRFYNILGGGAPSGPPAADVPFAIVGPGDESMNLPSEVAVCVTLLGTGYYSVPEFDYVNLSPAGNPTRPRSRRRGRIYLGPLNNNAIPGDPAAFSTDVPRVKSGLQADIGIATHRLAVAMDDGDWHLCLYSKVDDTRYDFDTGWVDDAFDTQRRRGEAKSGRHVFA